MCDGWSGRYIGLYLGHLARGRVCNPGERHFFLLSCLLEVLGLLDNQGNESTNKAKSALIGCIRGLKADILVRLALLAP